jgi:hypothetical protein
MLLISPPRLMRLRPTKADEVDAKADEADIKADETNKTIVAD